MTERFIIARFSAIFIFTMEMKYKGTKFEISFQN